MKELHMILGLLSEEVYTAKVGGIPIRDASDFAAWLKYCAKKAEVSTGVQDFFLKIQGD